MTAIHYNNEKYIIKKMKKKYNKFEFKKCIQQVFFKKGIDLRQELVRNVKPGKRITSLNEVELKNL